MKVWKKIGCFLLSLLFLISFTKKQVEAQSKDPMVLPVLTIGLDLQTSTSISGNRNRTLFIIGDSTSKSYHEKDKNTYPREGWGQEIFQSFRGAERVKRYTIPVKGDMSATQYVLPQITIESWGKSGATIKSCYESKRFSKILSRVREKDYVLIQFGHNDARKVWGETPNQYEKYLTDMVRKIKAKNAFPVLVTSLPQYNAKKFKINAPKYRMKMLKVSRTQKVACIDLNLECVNYFNLRGPKVIKNWYMFLDANKYKAYPKGLKDPTHFRKAGASVAARVIAVKMQDSPNLDSLAQNLNFNSKSLYKTLQKAEKYKKRKRFQKKSWERMKKMRKHGSPYILQIKEVKPAEKQTKG